MQLFSSALKDIKPLNKEIMKKAWGRIDSLTKPIGSLGTLEEISVQMSGITGELKHSPKKKNIIIMCGDNGVVDEGVSACHQNITAIVTENFTKGITGVCTLARFNGSDIAVVDLGVKADFDNPGIINRKISYGTRNMAKEPAMERHEVIKAIEAGIETVDDLVSQGYNLLGTGEMGIGNTATSAAVICALSGLSSDIVVGKGSGLTEEQLATKKRVIKAALELHKPDKEDVIDVLSKVGGFDIAGLCGCFLGAARNRVPIVIDGFISSAAALCAYKLNPLSKEYMFPSHLSAEPGAVYVMKELDLEPMVNLKMRLGEGTGCALAFNIIESALYAMDNMGTFEEANIVSDCFVDIRPEKVI